MSGKRVIMKRGRGVVIAAIRYVLCTVDYVQS